MSVSKSGRERRISLSALLVGAAVVIFLTRYNAQQYAVWAGGALRPYRVWEEYLVVNVTGLLFPAFLLIFGLLREEAAEFGFRPSQDKKAAQIAALFFVAMLPLLLFASRQRGFLDYYPIQPQAAFSWRYFLYYELTYGFYLFCWEFFYRGFLTFGLARGFGFPAAIGLQSLAFGIMHYGKPTPEFIGSFFAGIALGGLAARAKSFYPCFAVHWAVAVSFDLLAIHARPGGIL